MPERLVIANTSPLLYLQLVGRLDVLRALYGVAPLVDPARDQAAGDQVDPVPVALQVILFKQSMAKVGVWLVGAQGSLASTVVLGAHARALARDDAAVAESLVARLEGDLTAVEARARPGFADGRGRAKGLQVCRSSPVSRRPKVG